MTSLTDDLANVLREAIDPMNGDALICQKGSIAQVWAGKHCCCRKCIRERAILVLSQYDASKNILS
jgi:hypothetical protein